MYYILTGVYLLYIVSLRYIIACLCKYGYLLFKVISISHIYECFLKHFNY